MPSRESVDRAVGTWHSRYATADTNSVLVAASPLIGANATRVPLIITELAIYNNTAAAKYIKFYDKATAPTVGSDTPKMRLILPASGKIELSSFAGWGPFLLGLGYGITGAIGDADVTVLVANDVIMNLRYAQSGGL